MDEALLERLSPPADSLVTDIKFVAVGCKLASPSVPMPLDAVWWCWQLPNMEG